MDQRLLQLQYRVEHGHADGSWGDMVEEREPHDAADTDPEQTWSVRRVFRCTSCNEIVRITEDGEPATAPDAG
jgi:hypothetical protein